jgi:hypothetical protein
MHGCGAKKAIIAIEDDKQEAFNSLLMYNFNAHIEIVQIPTKYTSGAEKILIGLCALCIGYFCMGWESCTAHTNNTCFTNSLNNFARRTP